jgi:N-formylglutamate deformylase
MTPAGLSIPDTDWHVRKLYRFAEELGASIIAARYSRYVVDLNRSADDAALYRHQVATGLCPGKTFAGQDIYKPGQEITDVERQSRTAGYWAPYHDRLRAVLQELREHHGYVLLWDAHSIAAEVPLLFDGRLPDLNIGTNNGKSCDAQITAAAVHVAEQSPYSSVLNGRFRGGFITRHYGMPSDSVHAVQLELAQCCYMNETSLQFDARLAESLTDTIKKMLQACLAQAAINGRSTQ